MLTPRQLAVLTTIFFRYIQRGDESRKASVALDVASSAAELPDIRIWVVDREWLILSQTAGTKQSFAVMMQLLR